MKKYKHLLSIVRYNGGVITIEVDSNIHINLGSTFIYDTGNTVIEGTVNKQRTIIEVDGEYVIIKKQIVIV